MGADSFTAYQDCAPNVNAAFEAAVAEAQYESGHGGYTGTIAEKHEVTVIQDRPVTREEAEALAEKLIRDADPRVDDKWGPAGAIAVEGGGWLFVGWASS